MEGIVKPRISITKKTLSESSYDDISSITEDAEIVLDEPNFTNINLDFEVITSLDWSEAEIIPDEIIEKNFPHSNPIIIIADEYGHIKYYYPPNMDNFYELMESGSTVKVWTGLALQALCDPNELIPMYDYEENNINIEEIRLINGRTEIPVDEAATFTFPNSSNYVSRCCAIYLGHKYYGNDITNEDAYKHGMDIINEFYKNIIQCSNSHLWNANGLNGESPYDNACSTDRFDGKTGKAKSTDGISPADNALVTLNAINSPRFMNSYANNVELMAILTNRGLSENNQLNSNIQMNGIQYANLARNKNEDGSLYLKSGTQFFGHSNYIVNHGGTRYAVIVTGINCTDNRYPNEIYGTEKDNKYVAVEEGIIPWFINELE